MDTKSRKMPQILMFKNNAFSQMFFCRIFDVLASQNGTKITHFSYFYRKRRFCKNRAPVEAKLIFSRFRASKNRAKIDTKMHSKKTSKKRAPNVDFGIDFGLPRPPKSTPKASSNATRFATLWTSPATRRKPAHRMGLRLSPLLLI